jgi:hypothetical protein
VLEFNPLPGSDAELEPTLEFMSSLSSFIEGVRKRVEGGCRAS